LKEAFGKTYSEAYDAFYREKDYGAECDLIQLIFNKYGQGKITRVLDLGSGTGNHACHLAARGYRVTGVDASEHMLNYAREKCAATDQKNPPEFHQGDIRSVKLGEKYGAVLMMFAVLGYQVTDADVLAALKTARNHTDAGGLLVFDTWYGPAVLNEKPGRRVLKIPTGDGYCLRTGEGTLNVEQHICTVNYHLQYFTEDKMISESRETHLMRYFFGDEVKLFLREAGFSFLRMGAFPDFDKEPSEDTWNVITVAKAE